MFANGLTIENIDSYMRGDDMRVDDEPPFSIEPFEGTPMEALGPNMQCFEEMPDQEFEDEDVLETIKRDDPMLYGLLQFTENSATCAGADTNKKNTLTPPTFQLPGIFPLWLPPSRPPSPAINVHALEIDRSGWPKNQTDCNGFDDLAQQFMNLFSAKEDTTCFKNECTKTMIYNKITSCSKEGEHFRLFLIDDRRSKFKGKMLNLHLPPIIQTPNAHPIVVETSTRK